MNLRSNLRHLEASATGISHKLKVPPSWEFHPPGSSTLCKFHPSENSTFMGVPLLWSSALLGVPPSGSFAPLEFAPLEFHLPGSSILWEFVLLGVFLGILQSMLH